MTYAYIGITCLSCLISMLVIGITIKGTEAILKTIPPNKMAQVEDHQVSARFWLLLPLIATIYLVFFGRPDLINTVSGVAAIIGGAYMYRINYYDYARKISVENLQSNRPPETAAIQTAEVKTEAIPPINEEKPQ